MKQKKQNDTQTVCHSIVIHPSINFRDDECMSSIHIILIMKDIFIIIHRIRGSHAIQMTYKSIISDIFAPSIQYTTNSHN